MRYSTIWYGDAVATIQARTAETAIHQPSAAAADVTIAASASNCRTVCHGPAPNVTRIEKSRQRPTARGSVRFDMLAQAISSTNDAPAHNEPYKTGPCGPPL